MARAVLLYTFLRLLAFVFSFGVLLLAGVDGLLAVGGALLLSSLISLLLLRTPRDRFVAALEARRQGKADEQARLRGLLDDGPPST